MISERVQELGRAIAATPADDLGRALCEGLQALLGDTYRVATNFISDGKAQTEPLSAVVYTVPESAALNTAGAIPSDNAAAVIEALDELELAGFGQAYARVASVKRLNKAPPPNPSVSRCTLGILYARHTRLSLEALATELERLNAQTPHEEWLDMVVIAGKGVINYAIQFPGEGLSGDHLPPAPRSARDKQPPVYVVIVIRPVSNFSFNKLVGLLVGHLCFFSPGARLPNFEEITAGMPTTVIVQSGYQFNLAGALVPVPAQFRNDRYLPQPAFHVESTSGELLATIQRLPWQEGAVLLLRGNNLPLEGLMLFLDHEARPTTAIFRRPNDIQLSYVLPVSQLHFTEFLRRIERQSNMIVSPSRGKWVIQKLADEGVSSPFMARLLMGIMRIRDAAYPDPATRKSFDDIYEVIWTALISARDTAKEIDSIWCNHAKNVASGTCIRRSAHGLHIDETVDRDLRRLTEGFLNASARVLKHGLQQVARELGGSLGCWFQKQSAFERGIGKLTKSDPALATYLVEARGAWSETLMLRRIALEHEGWTLPKVAYHDEEGTITVVEPLIDGKRLREYLELMLDRLCCAVEDLTMHFLSTRLPAVLGLHEITLDQRVREAPERFRITARFGGDSLWQLCYDSRTFEAR